MLPLDYTKKFIDFNPEDIQKYYQWFLNIKHKRLIYFCGFLFQKKDDCLSEKNLNVIEFFLLNSVSTFPKPKEQFNSEWKRVPNYLKPYAKPDDYILDSKTISICYDIGIFLGDLIIKLDKKIKWELEIDDEFRDFGQPVLSKSNCKLKINPFTVAKNMATKMYEGTYIDEQIISVFNAWKKGFKVNE